GTPPGPGARGARCRREVEPFAAGGPVVDAARTGPAPRHLDRRLAVAQRHALERDAMSVPREPHRGLGLPGEARAGQRGAVEARLPSAAIPTGRAGARHERVAGAESDVIEPRHAVTEPERDRCAVEVQAEEREI